MTSTAAKTAKRTLNKDGQASLWRRLSQDFLSSPRTEYESAGIRPNNEIGGALRRLVEHICCHFRRAAGGPREYSPLCRRIP